MQDDTENFRDVPVGNGPDFILHSYFREEYPVFILTGVSTSAIGPAQIEYRVYTTDPNTQKIRCIEVYQPDGILKGIPGANINKRRNTK
jgi:hypothetical protein